MQQAGTCRTTEKIPSPDPHLPASATPAHRSKIAMDFRRERYADQNCQSVPGTFGWTRSALILKT
ncbi:hypothetical protein Agau_C100066 [Agrobacterium tumefaciens F2]|nr:hypothetical protein Agau_C100066 [Agrobacterium tumefaciens F2]